MCTRRVWAYSLVNKPLSRAKISLMVKVPRIVPVEADHRPSALRKTPPLRAGDPWIVRLTYIGDKRRKLVTAWRDCDGRSEIIVQRKVRCELGGSNSWDRIWGGEFGRRVSTVLWTFDLT